MTPTTTVDEANEQEIKRLSRAFLYFLEDNNFKGTDAAAYSELAAKWHIMNRNVALRASEQRVVALQEDRTRMDWLERAEANAEIDIQGMNHFLKNRSLRDAVDASIAKSKEAP